MSLCIPGIEIVAKLAKSSPSRENLTVREALRRTKSPELELSPKDSKQTADELESTVLSTVLSKLLSTVDCLFNFKIIQSDRLEALRLLDGLSLTRWALFESALSVEHFDNRAIR